MVPLARAFAVAINDGVGGGASGGGGAMGRDARTGRQAGGAEKDWGGGDKVLTRVGGSGRSSSGSGRGGATTGAMVGTAVGPVTS